MYAAEEWWGSAEKQHNDEVIVGPNDMVYGLLKTTVTSCGRSSNYTSVHPALLVTFDDVVLDPENIAQ